jgi:hypothetical protein
MFGKLMKPFVVTILCLAGIVGHAQVDRTLSALENVKSRIYSVVSSLRDPNLTNPSRLQLVQFQKSEIENELKEILKREARGLETDEIHDAAYVKIDELMMGLTAISILRLNADQSTIQRDSCDEAQTFLRLVSTVAGEVVQPTSYTPFIQTIQMMCGKGTSI